LVRTHSSRVFDVIECEWSREFDHNVWEAFWEAARRFSFRVIRRTPENDAAVHEQNEWIDIVKEVEKDEKLEKRKQEKEASEEAKLFNEFKFAAEFLVARKRKKAEEEDDARASCPRGWNPQPLPLPPLKPPPPPLATVAPTETSSSPQMIIREFQIPLASAPTSA